MIPMDKETLDRLDTLIELAEDLIILQALQAKIGGAAIRSFLGVDMNRVTEVSKMLKAARK
jgi:hypothetical protein